MDTTSERFQEPNIEGDRVNFILVTILYTLQGAVGGITAAIPNILQKRGVRYEDQAGFNAVWYPLSFKILYAPIVDSVYWKKVGRRKSWLITTQYFTGALLMFLSIYIDDWLGTEDGTRKPRIGPLTLVFFLCNLSNSVQDIALDAWTLTVFKKSNVAYSAVCQSVGLTTGYVLISASFTILESKDFRNMFSSVPQERGFITFSDFILFWSVVFLVITTCILTMKKESARCVSSSKIDDERDLRIKSTYKLVWEILRIPAVQMLCLFLLTRHISTAPIYNVASLKLVDNGITRDKLALVTLPLFFVQVFSPLVLNCYVTGRRPMRVFLLFYVLKLVNGMFYAAFVYLISYWKRNNIALPSWHYFPLIFLQNFDSFAFFVTMMAVVAALTRISDPRFGGVYLTLFHSVNNIGNFWPSTICLWLMNHVTIRTCDIGDAEERRKCNMIDGLYVEVALCSAIGLLWIFWAKGQILRLEKTDAEAFIVRRRRSATVETGVQLPLILVTEHQ